MTLPFLLIFAPEDYFTEYLFHLLFFPTNKFTHASMYVSGFLFNCLLIHLFIHSIIYLFIYLFILLFIYLFLYFFISLFLYFFICSLFLYFFIFIYLFFHYFILILILQPSTEIMIDIYRVRNPSNKEMKFIRKLHDTFPVSLSLLIPSIGNPKMTASNCILSSQELKHIYFDNEIGVDSKIDEYNEKYGGGMCVVFILG